MALSRAQRRTAKLAQYRQPGSFPLFAERELQIRTETPGEIIPFRLNGGQQILDRKIEAQIARQGYVRAVLLKGRQLGGSTYSEARLFKEAATVPNFNTLLIAYDQPGTSRIFDIAKFFLQNMSDDIRPATNYLTKSEIVFANPLARKKVVADPGLNSRMDFQHSGNVLAGTSSTRQGLHLSELGKWPETATSELAASLLPTIHPRPGTILIMESTAYTGGEYFREMCEQARSGKTQYIFCFVPWWLDSKNSIPLLAGEKLKLTGDEKRMMKLASRGQPDDDVPPHEVTPEQIKWYREREVDLGERTAQEFPCIAAGMRVGTQRGIIPIEEVRAGDRTQYGVVIEARCSGVKPVHRVQTYCGYSVIATADHPLIGAAPGELLSDTVVEVRDAEDQHVRLGQPLFAEDYHEAVWWDGCLRQSVRIDEDFGRFLGYFMGDGSLGKIGGQKRGGGSISIACDGQDADVIEDVKRLVTRFFGEPYVRVVGSRRGGAEVRKHTSTILTIAKGLGIYRVAAPHRLVSVPECIWRSPKTVVREFLRGLFEADACKRVGHSILLFSKHRQFLEDVQVLLLGFGIEGRLTTHGRRNQLGPYVANELSLTALATEAFGQRIGFIGERKRKRFNYIHNKLKVGRKAKPMMLADRVTSVRDLEKSTSVYDLMVEGNHQFDANGMRVHNCSFDDAWINLSPYVFNRDMLFAMRSDLRDPLRMIQITENGQLQTLSKGGQRVWADEEYCAIWQEPVHGVMYDCGVDVGHGVEGGDYSVAEVFRRDTHEQVVEFHKHIDPRDLGTAVYWLGKFYNNAHMIVEMNGPGLSTHKELVKRLYPYIYQWRHRERVVETMSSYAGWQTNRASKGLMIGTTAHLVNHRKLIVRSQVLLSEMMKFVRIDEEIYRAETGHDDAVLALLICQQGAEDESFHVPAPPPPEERAERPISAAYYDDRTLVDVVRNPVADAMMKELRGG